MTPAPRDERSRRRDGRQPVAAAVADAVADVVDLLRTRPPRAGTVRVVAVDGPSGAGKTTYAALLAVALGPPEAPAPVVHLDDIYPGWDGLEAAVPRLVEGVLAPLSRGEPARLRRHDWVLDREGDWYDVPVAPVVVVEGCAAGARACAPYLSALVWLEAPTGVRRDRGLRRDGEAYRPHWERWARQESRHFAREGTRDRADLVLDTGGCDV